MSPKTVAVGIDGSDESASAMRWGAEYVHDTGGIVHAITIWHLPVHLGYRMPASESELEQRARRSLDSVVRPVRTEFAKVDIRTHVRRGQVVDELVRVSNQVDLLVLGNKGHGAFTGMMVGSVALKLVHYARCSVVVAR